MKSCCMLQQEKPGGHYAKEKKPDTKGQIMHNPTYRSHLKEENGACQGLEGKGHGCSTGPKSQACKVSKPQRSAAARPGVYS